jgi:hypothetical protein
MLACAAALLAGETALASGDPEAATGFLRVAAEGFGALGAQWESARASLALAEALLAAEEEAEASRRLEHALTVFDRLGAVDELARAQELSTKARALSRRR